MRVTIRLTNLEKINDLLRAFIDLVRDDNALRQQIITNDLRFENLIPEDIALFQAELNQLNYSAFTTTDDSLWLTVRTRIL